MMPVLQKMVSKAKENVENEVRRIVKLPISQALTKEQVEDISFYFLSEEAYSNGERLHPEQATAMVQWDMYQGIFCSLGVGRGKTLISFMIAYEAYKTLIEERKFFASLTPPKFKPAPCILMVVQANLIDKFEADVPYMRYFLKNVPPYYVLRGANRAKRRATIAAKRRGLYVCSYNMLSSKDALDMLETLQPSVIICDEAQNVAGNRNSVRGGRFKKYCNKYQPKVVPLSGTITRKSVKDYHYLAVQAMKEFCFLPRPEKLADAWADILDSSTKNMGEFRNGVKPNPGPINMVCEWVKDKFPEDYITPNLQGFRKAFARRYSTAPGVIRSTRKESVDAQLILYNNECKGKEECKGWDRLQGYISDLLETYTTPSGEVLPCAMNVWGYRYQMEQTGFYYDLYWREPEEIAERRKISVSTAEDILLRSKDCDEMHREYRKKLRKWLEENDIPNLDSPSLIGGDMYRNKDKNVGLGLYKSWLEWKESVFEGLEERQSRPERVCDFKIRQIVSDVSKDSKKGGIVWYHNNEIGLWCFEELEKAGLNPIFCPRGRESNQRLTDSRPLKGKIIVASMMAHCTGKDLQFGFHRNFFVQNPISALTCEQAIGRTYRQHQYNDEVSIQLYLSGTFDHAHYNVLLADSAYQQQTTAEERHILTGSYTFRPKRVPRDALAEMGASLPKGDIGKNMIDRIVERGANK